MSWADDFDEEDLGYDDSDIESDASLIETEEEETESESEGVYGESNDIRHNIPKTAPTLASKPKPKQGGTEYRSSEDGFDEHEFEEGRNIKDIQSQIWRVLSQLDTSSTFTIGGHKVASVNPGLRIPDHGIVGLPLSERDANAIISKSRQSPFGKKEETIVDTTVRNSWELDASEISLDNPEWDKEIQEYVSKIYEGFDLACGRENVTAELYKMLLYKQGAFFKAHKDSEKVPGMFATLIVCLPSAHEGGTLVLQHGTDVENFVTASNSAFGTSWAAWYSDVTHQVTPVLSGYRLVLTYNLVRRSTPNTNYPIWAPNHDHHKSKLSELLKVYDQRLDYGEEELSPFLIHRLQHKYTKDGLKGSSLKGPDAAQLQALVQVSQDTGIRLYLAILELEFVREVYDESDRSQRLQNVVELDGALVAETLDLEDCSVIDPHQNDRIANEDYDDVEEEGWTGNEGAIERFWYRDAVVVMIPPSGYPDFVTTSGFSKDKALSLLRTLKEECTSDTTSELTQQRQLARLYSLVIENPPWNHSQLLSEATMAALEACDMVEFGKACEKTNGRVIVENAEAVGKSLSQIGITKMKPLLDQAVRTLTDLETRRHFLQRLESGMRSCEVLPPEADVQTLRQWSDDKIVQVAFDSTKVARKDGIALAKISEILQWDYFASTVMQKFSKTNTIVRVSFVNEFLRQRNSQLDESQTEFIEQAIERTWESFSFSIPASMTKKPETAAPRPYYRHLTFMEERYDCHKPNYSHYGARTAATPEPLDLLKAEDLRDFIQNSLTYVPSKTFEGYIAPKLIAAIAKAPSQVCSSIIVQFIRLVLEDGPPPVHLESPDSSPTGVQKALVQSFIKAYISKVVGPKPKKPKDWALPSPIEGKSLCQSCDTIKKFLANRNEKTYDFRGNDGDRKHLDSVFKYNDKSSYNINTVREGRFYVWRITKNESGFRKTLKEWEENHRNAKVPLSYLAGDDSASQRLHAYLDPHYRTFMAATLENLPDVEVPQPLAEVHENAATKAGHTGKGRKRGRGSDGSASGNATKKPKQENEAEDSLDENAPPDVEVIDLT